MAIKAMRNDQKQTIYYFIAKFSVYLTMGCQLEYTRDISEPATMQGASLMQRRQTT